MTPFTRAALAATTATAVVFGAVVPAYAANSKVVKVVNDGTMQKSDKENNCVLVNPEGLALQFAFNFGDYDNLVGYDLVSQEAVATDLKNALVKKLGFKDTDAAQATPSFDSGTMSVVFTIPAEVVKKKAESLYGKKRTLAFDRQVTISKQGGETLGASTSKNPGENSEFTVQFCPNPEAGKNLPKQNSSKTSFGKIIAGVLGAVFGLAILAFLIGNVMPKFAPALAKAV